MRLTEELEDCVHGGGHNGGLYHGRRLRTTFHFQVQQNAYRSIMAILCSCVLVVHKQKAGDGW
jgi:hypothetical protein